MKGTLDGVPDPDNPFIHEFLPWALQSEVLGPVTLLIAASSLSVTFNLTPYQRWIFKGKAIEVLNSYLRRGDISDEVIASVIQLMANEWYTGETAELLTHLKGVREIIRLRGGINNLARRVIVGKTLLLSVSHPSPSTRCG